MASEVKAILKEARELLKTNKYTEAMKKCRKILKKDEDNYGALVLLAAATQEVEEFKLQTPLVLQKAINVQPDNPLAWYGLVTYYEKESEQHDNWNKLAVAYCQLLQLNGNSPKFSYFLNKVSELSARLKDDAVLAQVINMLDELRRTDDGEKAKLINKTVAWIFTNSSINVDEHQDLFESVLASVTKDTDIVNREDYYRKYLKLLYRRRKWSILLEEAVEMHRQFPRDICPLEYACRVYYTESILGEDCTNIDITVYYNALLELDPASEAGIIAKAIYLKRTENLINAREILNELVISIPQSFYAWIILSDINKKLYCWEDAENSARQALVLAKNKIGDGVLQQIKLTLVESKSRSCSKTKWESAMEMCKNLLKTQPSAELQLVHARTKVLLNDPDIYNDLNILESQPETKVQANVLRALHLKNLKQYEEAANALDSALETSEAWSLLGQIYWEIGEYNHSLMAFLNGVKVDRYNWECLVSLGRYYCERGNDIERSRRCYQTALQINPNSEEAGIGLSTAYRLLKNREANVQLLQRLTTQDSGPKWAWLQLGLQYLDHGDAVQAIKAFQHVIRADPHDNHSWESLADAYLVRGAYTSALRSYQRALELCAESLYPMIQIANIKLFIGRYSEAKLDFECILLNEPYYVPALKGLGETCLRLANENAAQQFLGRARDNLQQAIDTLTVAVMERTDLSCIWKLLGDVCYKTAIMSEKYSYLTVRSVLIKSDSTAERVTIKRRDILSLSRRCYCRALSLSLNSALLWHDLASCYLTQLKLDPLIDHKAIASKCLAAGKHAVKLCPTSWLHWNLLGVICMSPYIKNYALAQHAYVMAIDKESNNAVVWSNLGTLYLCIGNLYKANKAYSLAQRSDPAYINSWIGQSLIAEKSNRMETMDLFRHSTQLGYHNQAAVGYADWVLTGLLNSKMKEDPLYMYMLDNMHAVPVATDVLNWYIEHEPSDSYARNTYGLLLERQKLYRSAAEQFAVVLYVTNTKIKDAACINLARVLIKLGRYIEAVELCRTVKNTSFNSQCHLALSLFKAEQYEESYIAYQEALHTFANTETEKANTLCAMAAMAYIFQGVDDAKTLLFQCIQIQPIFPAGFLAAASLGILHGDINLTTLVLKELEPYKDDPKYGEHIVNLYAYSFLIQNKISNAVSILCKAVHKHPYDTRYWVRLLRILLETDMYTFNRCARKALFLSRQVTDINIVHVACASSIDHFMQNLVTDGIRSVQKILFTYPGNVESWATFIAAYLPRCADRASKSNAQWLSTFISVVQRMHQPKNVLAEWLHSSKKRIDAICQITETY